MVHSHNEMFCGGGHKIGDVKKGPSRRATALIFYLSQPVKSIVGRLDCVRLETFVVDNLTVVSADEVIHLSATEIYVHRVDRTITKDSVDAARMRAA